MRFRTRQRDGPQSVDSLAAMVRWDPMMLFTPPTPLAPSPGHAPGMARHALYRPPPACIQRALNEAWIYCNSRSSRRSRSSFSQIHPRKIDEGGIVLEIWGRTPSDEPAFRLQRQGDRVVAVSERKGSVASSDSIEGLVAKISSELPLPLPCLTKASGTNRH